MLTESSLSLTYTLLPSRSLEKPFKRMHPSLTAASSAFKASSRLPFFVCYTPSCEVFSLPLLRLSFVLQQSFSSPSQVCVLAGCQHVQLYLGAPDRTRVVFKHSGAHLELVPELCKLEGNTASAFEKRGAACRQLSVPKHVDSCATHSMFPNCLRVLVGLPHDS